MKNITLRQFRIFESVAQPELFARGRRPAPDPACRLHADQADGRPGRFAVVSPDRQVANDTLLGSAAIGFDTAPRFMELGCSEAIRQSVIAGMGIGLLSAREVQADMAGEIGIGGHLARPAAILDALGPC